MQTIMITYQIKTYKMLKMLQYKTKNHKQNQLKGRTKNKNQQTAQTQKEQ